jgi:hypothetical protein
MTQLKKSLASIRETGLCNAYQKLSHDSRPGAGQIVLPATYL